MPDTNFYRTRPSKMSLPEAKAGRAANKCNESSVVVEFRPLNNWDGEFGFDWLRVTEAETRNIEKSYIRNANKQTGIFQPNNADFGLVQSGYGTATTDLNDARAQTQIKSEYIRHPINAGGRTSNNRHLTYYVPYLNLYPQNDLALLQDLATGLTEYASTKPRPYSAELRMIVDIKGQSPESIEIEFNNKDFNITLNDPAAELEINENISSLKIPVPNNYTPTPDTQATSRKLVTGSNDLIVTITCLRALTANKEINVYAYHEQDDTTANKQTKEDLKKINELHNKANPGTPDDPTTVILTKRKLAGQLIVLKNDVSAQKELKVVLIKVRTRVDITIPAKDGTFTPAELTKLSGVLHQALVHPRIITQLSGNNIILNLKNDNNFKKDLPDTTKSRELGNGYYAYDNGNIHKNQTDFDEYIYSKFINTEINIGGTITKPYQNLTRDNGYFLVFIFADRGNLSGGLLGNVLSDSSGNFIKSVALYAPHATDTATIPHEALHGLQLRHTHRDGSPPLRHPNCKYIFPNSSLGAELSTSNIMSYNVNTDAYSSWRWQWEVIQANV